MLALVAGMCITLQGFVWHVDLKLKDTVNLSYPVTYRTDMSGKVEEVVQLKSAGLWKMDYVSKNAKSVVCPKNYKP